HGITPKQLRGVFSRATRYLSNQQRPDGSWIPLWFGNQFVAEDLNPLYGTCKVLSGYRALDLVESAEANRGIDWLVRAENSDGGWGGSLGALSSVEETGLAVEALAGGGGEKVRAPIGRGVQWLLDRVESGDWRNPSP